MNQGFSNYFCLMKEGSGSIPLTKGPHPDTNIWIRRIRMRNTGVPDHVENSYVQTGGTRPSNVLIRITLPGQEFASKFGRAPEEHYFPLAGVGFNSCVAVSVRSLPRSGALLRWNSWTSV
jgi:hypothetical protein